MYLLALTAEETFYDRVDILDFKLLSLDLDLLLFSFSDGTGDFRFLYLDFLKLKNLWDALTFYYLLY